MNNQYNAPNFLLTRKAFSFGDQLLVVDIEGGLSSLKGDESLIPYAVIRFAGSRKQILARMNKELTPVINNWSIKADRPSHSSYMSNQKRILDAAVDASDLFECVSQIRLEDTSTVSLFPTSFLQSCFTGDIEEKEFKGGKRKTLTFSPESSERLADWAVLMKSWINNLNEGAPDFMVINQSMSDLLLFMEEDLKGSPLSKRIAWHILDYKRSQVLAA